MSYFISGLVFISFHFIIASSAFSMADIGFEENVKSKSKSRSNLIKEAKQNPRKFAYLDNRELRESNLTRKKLYIKFLNSLEDIKTPHDPRREYILVKMEKIEKILNRNKFDDAHRLVMENIDQQTLNRIKNSLLSINPFAIEYVAQGKNDAFAQYIQFLENLYNMQLQVSTDLAEEIIMPARTLLPIETGGETDEEMAFKLQLMELGNNQNNNDTPSINPAAFESSTSQEQIYLDEEYARRLQYALDEE